MKKIIIDTATKHAKVFKAFVVLVTASVIIPVILSVVFARSSATELLLSVTIIPLVSLGIACLVWNRVESSLFVFKNPRQKK